MSNTTILVAEDEPDLLRLVSHRLQRSGYNVIVATDGDQAMDLIRQHHPALCFLDVMMPARNGLDVLQEMRSHEEMSDIKVVLLTARSASSDIERGAALGADDYLIKPVPPKDLMSSVDRLLKQPGSGRQ